MLLFFLWSSCIISSCLLLFVAPKAAAIATISNANNECPPPTVSVHGNEYILQWSRDSLRAERYDGTPIPQKAQQQSNSAWQHDDTLGIEIYKYSPSPYFERGEIPVLTHSSMLVFQFAKFGQPQEDIPNLFFRAEQDDEDYDPQDQEEEELYQEQDDVAKEARGVVTPMQGDEDPGWYLAAAYLYETDKPLLQLKWNESSTSFSSSYSNSNKDVVLLCENVTFDFVSDDGDDSVSARVQLQHFYVAPYFDNRYTPDFCDGEIVSPCQNDEESTICNARNGDITCVKPPNDGASGLSPIPGVSRREYIDLYACPTIGRNPVVDQSQASKNYTTIYWDGGASFLQASNANITLANGDRYKFNDKYQRDIRLYSGVHGETIERSSDWEEDYAGSSRNRRVHLFMDPQNFTGDTYSQDGYWHAQDQGWFLWRLYVYAYGPWQDAFEDDYDCRFRDDWIFGLFDGYDMRVPSADHVFHCDYVEFTLDQRDPDYPPPPPPFTNQNSNESSTYYGGKMTFTDFYLGAFLGEEEQRTKNICDYNVYNPCAVNNDGNNYFCHAINGIVTCLEATDDNNLSIMRRSSSSASSHTNMQAAEELLCESPHVVDDKLQENLTTAGSTLLWKLDDAYISASNVNLVYKDGTDLTLEDELGRKQCLFSNNDGRGTSMIARDSMYWVEGNRTRFLRFTFKEEQQAGRPFWYLYESTVSENNYDQDLLTVRIHDHHDDHDDNHNPPTLGAEKLMICDYVQLEYKNPDTNNVKVTFSAHQVVMGAFLADNYNVCELPLYNPCSVIPDTPVCHFMGGRVQCEATLMVENPIINSNDSPTGYSAECAAVGEELPLTNATFPQSSCAFCMKPYLWAAMVAVFLVVVISF